MRSFFKLVEKIQAELLQDLCADEDEYDEDEYEELSEEDESFRGEDKYKSFEQLIEDEIEEQENHQQPYVQALLSLLESHPKQEFDVNERDPDSGCTMLMKIASIGKLDLVQTLVEAGADVIYPIQLQRAHWVP